MLVSKNSIENLRLIKRLDQPMMISRAAFES